VSRVGRFLALPAADRGLLIQALVTTVMVRLALPLVAIGRLRAWATAMGSGTTPVDRIAWAAGAATRSIPGTTCLVSALALQRLLSRQGHVSELRIGVAKENQAFAAHAWLICEGRVLAGEEEHAAFTPLAAWTSTDHSGGAADGKPDRS
jgi:hypothetical protein